MPDKVTLGAALIVGPNRLEQLKRLLPQLAKLDQVVIINTSGQGAVNNYVKHLKKPFECYNDAWRPTPYKPEWSASRGEVNPLIEPEMYDLNDWGFARARNISLSKLTTDYGFWIDTDDVLGLHYQGQDRAITPDAVRDGFLKLIAEAPDIDVWFADYHYAYDEAGNPNVVHARERLFKNPSTWKVVYPIHECFVPDHAPKHSIIKDIKFLHLPDPQASESSAERNMRMLTDWLKQIETYEDPDHHDLQRCRLLYGDTLYGMERYTEAAHWLEHTYLDNHPNAISVEKWQAACFACKSYLHSGNLTGAKRMAMLAIDLEPALMDGYLLLAEVKLLNEEDPHDVLALLQTGGQMDDPPPQVIKNPLDYTFTPFCLTSECKYQQGQYEVALDFAVKALKIRPTDERAEKLRVKAAHKLREHEATRAAMAMYQYLSDFDEHEKAAQIFNFLPYVVQRSQEIHKIATGANNRVAHISNPERYIEYYEQPPDWEPTEWLWFEKGIIPGRDKYEYILSRLKKRKKIKKVLVVGCDDGFHSILLAKEGYDVTGIDLNKEAIRIANERAEKLGVTAKFQQGWFERDPDELNWIHKFDAVISTDQLDRVRDVAFYLETLGDCAKDGAPIIITTPDGAWDGGDVPYNRREQIPQAVRTFSEDQFEELLKNPDYHVTECHRLDYKAAYREGQGWLVAEIARMARPNGPIIRIFCGELAEAFSPENLESGGIGGSETAVIQMAAHWAKAGCVVGVYGGKVGIYDGVFYRHADEYTHELKSDIFIGWRLPQLFKVRPNADVTVLWCHDIHYPIVIEQTWIDNIDLFAVLSDFHKGWIMDMHKLPEEKMWVTRNGIDPARYAGIVEKVPHSYFFSSSHDRGLEELLLLWPKVRKEIPDATLHVAYGTMTAANAMKDRKDYEGLDELRALESYMFDTPGVIYHGRMNQRELAQMQMSCEAWLYPPQLHEKWGGSGGFLETYCITALEADAAGCIPITRINGALPEVLKNYVEWKAEWTADDLITTLKLGYHTIGKLAIEENRKWALTQSWSSLATEWLQKFKEQKERTTKDVPELQEALTE